MADFGKLPERYRNGFRPAKGTISSVNIADCSIYVVSLFPSCRSAHPQTIPEGKTADLLLTG